MKVNFQTSYGSSIAGVIAICKGIAMKKRARLTGLCGIFCMLLFFAACGKTKIEPGVPLQDVLTEYESEGVVKAVTTLKDGTAFAIIANETQPHYWIHRFDTQGKCTGTYPLNDCANIDTIVAEEDGDTIYFMGQSNSLYVNLMKYRISTGETETLTNFGNAFSQATHLVLLDDKIYAKGQRSYSSALHMSSAAMTEYDFSAKDVIMYYSFSEGYYLPLDLKYPVSMADSGNGTLIVLAYYPDNGYCLVEYDPQEDACELRTALDNYKFFDFAVCNSGKSLVYDNPWSAQGIVISDLDNIDLEIEVYDNFLPSSPNRVWAGGGRIFLQDFHTQKLISFPLDSVQKKNKAVSLVATPELSSVVPYGCGYTLERMEESWDKIALKMLAQDRDYDLCMGSSEYAGSITLRDSGTMYPLNDLPGIEEYLDRCLPYLREAAVDENGTIWMLPFSASILTLRVQEEQLAQAGIDLRDNMTIREFAEVVSALSPEEAGRLDAFPNDISSNFLRQYFWHNTTAQDEFFLETLKSLRALHQNEDLLRIDYVPGGEPLLSMLLPYGKEPEMELMATRDGASLLSIPKGRAEDKNNVTVYFLCVNKKSKNRTEALQYLTDLITYLMRKNEFYCFLDYEAEPGSLQEQIHRLFENGEICFAIDEDVCGTDYIEVLSGDRPLEEYALEVERRLQLYRSE